MIQSIKFLPKTQGPLCAAYMRKTRRAITNQSIKKCNYRSIVLSQVQLSGGHLQDFKPLCGHNRNSSLQSSSISSRDYSSLPSKQQVERVTYRALAKSIDFVKAVRSSEGYHDLKRGMWNTYLWSIEAFKKNVLENPKVKSYSQDVKRKIEAAREERRRDR